MIPAVSEYFTREITVKEQPSLTYKMNPESLHITGRADGPEAMRQAVYKILMTERYAYVMYSWGYGIETADLYGQPVSYVCAELPRRISEALLYDGRVKGVDGFAFYTSKRGRVSVSFTVHTIFGDVSAKKAVNV